MLIQKIKFINVLLGKNLDPYFLWTFTFFTQTTYQWWKQGKSPTLRISLILVLISSSLSFTEAVSAAEAAEAALETSARLRWGTPKIWFT